MICIAETFKSKRVSFAVMAVNQYNSAKCQDDKQAQLTHLIPTYFLSNVRCVEGLTVLPHSYGIENK